MNDRQFLIAVTVLSLLNMLVWGYAGYSIASQMTWALR